MCIKINQKTKYPLELDLYSIPFNPDCCHVLYLCKHSEFKPLSMICKESWNLWWKFYFAYLTVLLTFKAREIDSTTLILEYTATQIIIWVGLSQQLLSTAWCSFSGLFLISQHKYQQFSIYT